MNENDKEILLYRILSGLTYFLHNSERYVLYSPNKEIKYEAALVYNNILNEEKYQDWMREENLNNIMIGAGVWNVNTNDNIKKLENGIDELKVELFKNYLNSNKQKLIRNNLRSARRELGKLFSLKNDFMSNTLEGYASSIKNEYIICRTLYKNSKLVFDYESKKSDNFSYSLFNRLIAEIEKLVITAEEFKIIARSSIWKSYWNLNKYNKIFDNSLTNWTDEQKALVNISKMYDNIYEHPECPDDKIIDDDDMLDGWMILQKRKSEKEKKQKLLDEANPHLKGSGEVFLFGQSKEDIDNIISLNTDESKSILKEKLSTIAQKGEISDGDLPDVRRNLQEQINLLNKQVK